MDYLLWLCYVMIASSIICVALSILFHHGVFDPYVRRRAMSRGLRPCRIKAQILRTGRTRYQAVFRIARKCWATDEDVNAAMARMWRHIKKTLKRRGITAKLGGPVEPPETL